MAPKTSASSALALSLLFVLLTSSFAGCPPKVKKPKPPKPSPSPSPPIIGAPLPVTPTPSPKCPIDTLKLDVCADVLGGLINLNIGASKSPCCSLLSGLADLDAAVCLCTAIKANILGINLNLPLNLSLLLNYCGKGGSRYQCA